MVNNTAVKLEPQDCAALYEDGWLFLIDHYQGELRLRKIWVDC